MRVLVTVFGILNGPRQEESEEGSKGIEEQVGRGTGGPGHRMCGQLIPKRCAGDMLISLFISG